MSEIESWQFGVGGIWADWLKKKAERLGEDSKAFQSTLINYKKNMARRMAKEKIVEMQNRLQESLDWRLGTYTFNSDAMFHVSKGATAFKLDGVRNILVQKSSVTNLKSLGKQGLVHKTLPFPTYDDDQDSSIHADDTSYLTAREASAHPRASLTGYNGAAARGFSFASSANVVVEESSVKDSLSTHGVFVAFDVHFKSSNVLLNFPKASRVFSGADTCFANNRGNFGNCKACGVRIPERLKALVEAKDLVFEQNTWSSQAQVTEKSGSLKLLSGIPPRAFDYRTVVVRQDGGKALGCGVLEGSMRRSLGSKSATDKMGNQLGK